MPMQKIVNYYIFAVPRICMPIDEKPLNLCICTDNCTFVQTNTVETGNKSVHLRGLLARVFARISQTALNSVKKYIYYTPIKKVGSLEKAV